MQLHAHELVGFLRHLRSENTPFVQRRTAIAPDYADEPLHGRTFQQDPELYALCGVAANTQPAQRCRVLFQLLAQSWVDLSEDVRRILERVIGQLLASLESDAVLTVFLALRRARANHKHTARTILRYLLNHPRLAELAQRRRPTLVDCLEHALGRDVARACGRLLSSEGPVDAYVRRHLLRFADDPQRARAVMAFLYGHGPALPVPVEAELPTPAVWDVPIAERPRTVTATNRGDIAATLVHVYRGGANAELNAALDRYVAAAAATLPRFDGTVALVLDASGSTRGYGEREFCCVSQSQALRLVLERCCANLRVYPVGGSDNPPRPEGDSDLALALLDALEGNPDVVAIVSDGYENVLSGDLARAIASLPAAGVAVPVIFCHSKFTDKDDLTLRRPAPQLPEVEFWHQSDFAELLWLLFAQARSPRGEAFVRGQLRNRLTELEEVQHGTASRSASGA